MTKKEEFEALVAAKVKTGKPFILAVYATINELAVAENSYARFACHRGCSACCYQPAVATTLEARAIVKYVQQLDRQQREGVSSIAISRAEAFHRWITQYDKSDSRIYDPVWLHSRLDGRPCVFLARDGSCGVHPVRPMDCRTFHSTSVCVDRHNPDAVRMAEDFERWANNLVLEEEQRRNGSMAVSLLASWVLTYRSAFKGER